MARTENTKAYIFIDYVPAQFKENKIWEVIYWVKNPITNKLIRRRNRVKPMKSSTERRKLALNMVKNINNKLEQGWNPFITNERALVFKCLIPEMAVFIKRKQIELQKNDLRQDTYRSYRSFVNNIKKYLIQYNLEGITISDFNVYRINEFLDHIYYERENSIRTRNNYLGFIITLYLYFKSRKLSVINPAENIPYLRSQKKDKLVIDKVQRDLIVNYLKKHIPSYLVLCLACYYCMIRRTEMTKIKVKDIILKQSIINVKNEYSKNKKTQTVTIPDNYMKYLVSHIKDANNSDFLFSANNYKTGPKQLNPKKITDEWTKLRKVLELPDHIVWYHLKDTGITDLLLSGIKPIKVRDQARHHSIQQTEEYTPKELMHADLEIKKNDIKF